MLVVITDSTPSVPGTVTIRLVQGAAEPPAKGECVTAAPTAWDAWRMLAGVAPEQFSGYRAIVDGQGWLRAWLPPGAATEQVLAAVRDASTHPIAAGAPIVGHHH